MPAFLEVHFVVTLMRLTDIGYVESGDREFVYYFAAPDAWAHLSDPALQTRVLDVARRMYEELNRGLHAAEPSDPNYLYVKSTRARVLAADEATSWPWLSANKPVWEITPCVVVNADSSYVRVNVLELGNAVPAERDHVRLDRVLPVLLAKHLPSCVAAYSDLYERFRDPRPLDERSRNVWGAAVLFFCVLDRLATGGEYADPSATVDEMITWLAEGGEVPRDDVESARQIYRRLFDYHVYRPSDTLFEMVYERAWFVRYPDLDGRSPSAFQGFIHCLTGCRDTLNRFDFDDPRRTAAPPTSRLYEKIEAFNRSAVLPAFDEIKTTLERHGKRVFTSQDGGFGDEFLEHFYREVHGSAVSVRELETNAPGEEVIAAGSARYLGYSLVAVDPEPAESRYAGKFFETIVFNIGQNESVYASPFVFYHMKFDNKLHGFEHQFDNARARQEIATIDKSAIQNHFLNAYDFFKINARRDERPW